MQTRANILNNPEEALSLLSKWGINPKDAEISGASHYDQGFLHIRMKQGTLSYQLRYTLATPRNQSILRDQVKIVTKWKEKGIGVEEYISTSEGKLYLRDGNHLYVLIKNCPFPQITECKEMPLAKLGEALGQLHKVSVEENVIPTDKSASEAIEAVFTQISRNLEKSGGDSRAEGEREFLHRVVTAAPAPLESLGYILGLPTLADIRYDEAEQKIYFTHFEHVHPFFFAQDLACFTRAIARHFGDKPHTDELNAFLNGYREVMTFPEEEEALLELFTRVAALEEFSNLLFSTSEIGQNESAEQLLERCKLFNTMSELGDGFGSPAIGFSMKNADTQGLELIKSVMPVFYTGDLLATTTWYEDVLRFKVFHDQDVEGRNIAVACRDKIRLTFVELPGKKILPVRELYGEGLDGYFRTDEPEILQAEMVAEGVTIVQELSRTDFSLRAFVFEDVDGRRFEVRYEKV